jgi:hypothetical protein
MRGARVYATGHSPSPFDDRVVRRDAPDRRKQCPYFPAIRQRKMYQFVAIGFVSA